MKLRSVSLFLLLPVAASAQFTLPGFQSADTITRICPWDTTITVLTYTGWEAYQTVDDVWNGPVDSTVCIALAHVVGGTVEARIDFDDTDQSRPVFLRLLLDSASAIPLASDNEYSIAVDGFPLIGTALDPGSACTEGLCTGIRAAVRVPDSTGMSTELRWYQASYGSAMFDAPFSVCLPTERFTDNALRELVLKFSLAAPGAGQRYRLFSAYATDFLQEGSLVRLTEAVLPQYQVGPAAFDLGFGLLNFLVMYEDTTYPGPDHVSYLDFTPLPNVATPTTVTVTLQPFTGFNFQPYTQLRGGAVLNNDSVFHDLVVVNNGADLCLSSQIVELIWGNGYRYVHQEGHLGFEGARSCFLFKRGSVLEVAPGAVLHYGLGNRGMLALNAGSDVVVGAGGELVMHGMVVLKEGGGATTPQDLHTTLGPGARLTFAPGSRIFNGGSLDGTMKWVITVDRGAVDLDGLSAADRLKVVLVELPSEPLTGITTTVLFGSVQFSGASRASGLGTLRCFDAVGRCLADRNVQLPEGSFQLTLDTPGWPAGAYLAVLEVNGERRVARWVSP